MEMNITQAMKHFEWKLKNKWGFTEKDLEAYNVIVDFIKKQQSHNLVTNQCFAKLWIYQHILLSNTRGYEGARCQEMINEILSQSVYDWCLKLKEEIPMMRFRAIGNHKYPLTEEILMNRTKMIENNKKIVAEFEDELTAALTYEISEEEIIEFVERRVTEALHKYEE